MHWAIGQNCLICKQHSHTAICVYCCDDLSFFDLERYHYNLMLAPQVKMGLSKVDFPLVVALSDYQWPISKLLSSLKFSARIPNSKALAELFFARCLQAEHCRPELIIPMPLHKNRYLFRKFNQSIELTKHIAKLAKVKMNTSVLSRRKSTTAQTDLSAAQRRKNLANAFAVNLAPQHSLENYQHIALFDDVITTGTTMNSAYLCLAKHYPKLRIDVWSICLTLTD